MDGKCWVFFSRPPSRPMQRRKGFSLPDSARWVISFVSEKVEEVDYRSWSNNCHAGGISSKLEIHHIQEPQTYFSKTCTCIFSHGRMSCEMWAHTVCTPQLVRNVHVSWCVRKCANVFTPPADPPLVSSFVFPFRQLFTETVKRWSVNMDHPPLPPSPGSFLCFL